MSDSSLIHAIAGSAGGAASLALTYPLYSRMLRQQVQEKKRRESGRFDDQYSRAPPSRGWMYDAHDMIANALTHKSLNMHFAGLQSALFAISIQNGVFYYFFQKFKNIHCIDRSPLGNLLVSTEAGIATVMLTNALWVVNARQITDKDDVSDSAKVSSLTPSPSLSSLSCSSSSLPSRPSLRGLPFLTACRVLLSTEGLSGLYAGVGPALLLVASPAIQFFAYEHMCGLVLASRRGTSSSLVMTNIELFFLGAISKIIATLMTYPILTVKAKLQQASSPYATRGAFKGIVDCCADMYRSIEGVKSFYRGLNAKIVQTSLTAAFLFLLRERILRLLVAVQPIIDVATATIIARLTSGGTGAGSIAAKLVK